MTRSIYEYLTDLSVQEHLLQYEQQFEQEGNLSLAKEYSQIYGMVMDLFDKLVMLLGDCQVSLEEYAQLLDAGFSEMKVGLIPAGTDQVVVGDMERSRLKDIKILFFAGVNEGSGPGDLVIPECGAVTHIPAGDLYPEILYVRESDPAFHET